MNNYITGKIIKELREKKRLTQLELANIISVSDKTIDRCEIQKLYPEQNAEARFLRRGKGIVYVYCNKDGLIKKII